MIKFKELTGRLVESEDGLPILTEEFHPEIRSIMDSEDLPIHHKLNQISKKLRELNKRGEFSGIENSTPRKGSSRAVFFSKDPEEIEIDGQKAHVMTATKIAFPGQLDKYTGDSMLLGEHQNIKEMDYHIQRHYSVLTPTDKDGSFKYNPHGVVFPILTDHNNGYHWLRSVKLDKFSSKDMQNHTKNSEFPKGITQKDFSDTLNYHHDECHGSRNRTYSQEEHEKFAKLSEHPFVDSAISMMHDVGMHPGDISPKNMGTFVHPITGARHPVILDYGFDENIEKLYSKARKKYGVEQQRRQQRRFYLK